MFFLLTGKNENLIERTLTEIARKYPNSERVSFNAKDVTPNRFVDSANTFDLLQQPPLITLKFDKQARPEPFYDLLSQLNAKAHVIFIFPFDLPQSHIFVTNPKNIKFIRGELALKTVSDVFKFTDYLYSGKRTEAYKELNALLSEGNDTYYIVSMCLYSLRNIFNVTFSSPELSTMKDFPRRKAIQYAKAFTPEDVKVLFCYMYELDKKAKTGQIDINIGLCLVCEKILSYTKS